MKFSKSLSSYALDKETDIETPNSPTLAQMEKEFEQNDGIKNKHKNNNKNNNNTMNNNTTNNNNDNNSKEKFILKNSNSPINSQSSLTSLSFSAFPTISPKDLALIKEQSISQSQSNSSISPRTTPPLSPEIELNSKSKKKENRSSVRIKNFVTLRGLLFYIISYYIVYIIISYFLIFFVSNCINCIKLY